MRIDLNCDMGESYGKACSYDEQIMPYISSANIACGFHSGDPISIEETIKEALRHNVAIGAHPSYPDLQGFGRREMKMTSEDLEANVRYQVAALKGITESFGGVLNHVKPHGALYNAAARDKSIAQAIVNGIRSISEDVFVYGLSGSIMQEVVEKSGLEFRAEVFADRVYEDNLQLRSRTLKDAVIHDSGRLIEQVKHLALDQQVQTISGLIKPLKAESICLHSDTPGAVELAKEIHDFLVANNVEISAN